MRLAISGFMEYTSEDTMSVICDNIEVWVRLRNMLTPERKLDAIDRLCGRLVESPIFWRVSMDRLPGAGRVPDRRILWATVDATPEIISGPNWAYRSFIRVGPADILASVDTILRHRYTIDECELGSIAVQLASWAGPSSPKQLTFSGTDNVNALSWADQ